ncbi:MBL fold metallo-hydrolase [Rhizocola hellebori]|uniref:MBL fold metallo-hydrolase n=1 Tax=Rhizocola hellebori TaxID=1392758 RepID=A0A8J3QAN0_9ACTN|nr:MBL fold metallo-hydrolase [Rhizocola hellebori]GIH07259.1 MBL fold metallo-hydrolase [Rhizocola hellebori]
MRFTEIADRVYLLPYPAFNVNCTLIVGDERALLIDTLSDHAQGGELGEAVRQVTPLEFALVNTHFHFDHCFGNAVLAPEGAPIWGHPDTAKELAERGEHWRLEWEAEYGLDLSQVRIVPPNQLVGREATIQLGGREVVLSHHGRGHTAGDIVARVDGVLVAGDLVEQGAPPAFEDAYPLEWPEALAQLQTLCGPQTVIVPGHGEPVGRDFLDAQHDLLTRLDWLIREGHADAAPQERVVAASPLNQWGQDGLAQSRIAVKRGFAQLSGQL